jgi:hypothetical protein
LFLPVELEEHRRLVPQDVRIDRLVKKIHGTGVVTFEEPMLVVASGRHENDRHVPGALRAAHDLREFKAVHVRHLHVEKRESHVVLQQELECFCARICGEDLYIRRAQQSGQSQYILFEIIDDQALHVCLQVLVLRRDRHHLGAFPPCKLPNRSTS